MTAAANVPVVVWITWLFALWWVFLAFRDYNSASSRRRGNGTAFALALVAAGQLAWMGYLQLRGIRELVLLTLVGFAMTLVFWSIVGRRRASK